MSPPTILDLVDVSVRFGGVSALTGVSFGLRAGEICGLIGPNGAGKTTLIDVISGLRAPSSGRVELDGADVTAASVTTRARAGVRRTFQRQQTFGALSVADNVMTALEWHGGGGGLAGDLLRLPSRRRRERERRDSVAAALELCGLSRVADTPASRLPLGTARMCELARAIVDRPRVLLLDEPTSGLEERDAARMGEIIEQVRHEHQCAILLVEHDVAFVMSHVDRVIALHLGAVLSQGSPSDVRADPAVIDAYFGQARS